MLFISVFLMWKVGECLGFGGPQDCNGSCLLSVFVCHECSGFANQMKLMVLLMGSDAQSCGTLSS